MSLRNKAFAFNLSYMYNDKHDYTLLYQQISEARSHATSIGPFYGDHDFSMLEHCGPNVDDDLNYAPPNILTFNFLIFWTFEDDIASCYPSMDLSLVTNEISTEIDSLYLASLNRRKVMSNQINFPQAINLAIKDHFLLIKTLFSLVSVLTIRSVSLGLLLIFLNYLAQELLSPISENALTGIVLDYALTLSPFATSKSRLLFALVRSDYKFCSEVNFMSIVPIQKIPL